MIVVPLAKTSVGRFLVVALGWQFVEAVVEVVVEETVVMILGHVKKLRWGYTSVMKYVRR